MKFSSEYQPAKRGRPKGAKNKKSLIPEQLTELAVEKWVQAVEQGKPWAITAVLDRTHPRIRAIVEKGSLESRLSKIEERLKSRHSGNLTGD